MKKVFSVLVLLVLVLTPLLSYAAMAQEISPRSAYVKAKDVKDAPWFQLKGLKKVQLAKGTETSVELVLKDEAFALYDEDAAFVLNEGFYEVFVGTSQPDSRSIALTGKKPESFSVVCKKREIL